MDMHRTYPHLGGTRWLPAFALFCAVAAIAIAGCGPTGPRKIKISGVVTLDGSPLADGNVIFIPLDPALGAAGGSIAAGGFTIEVYPGPHRIEVYADKKESRPIGPNDPPELGFTLTSLIPVRYNKKSTLTFDVQSPQDRPEFALTSQQGPR
jgi:hypothetical protein